MHARPSATPFSELLVEDRLPSRAILSHGFDERDVRAAAAAAPDFQADTSAILLPRRQIGDELETERAAGFEHAVHLGQRAGQIPLPQQRLQDPIRRHDDREGAGTRKEADVALNEPDRLSEPGAPDARARV